uniref:Leucine-rich repeat-containing protein 58 n=1 Tax=Xenopus tropicalis TaxID=8364 RepID=A0A1B8Y0E3_XENTR
MEGPEVTDGDNVLNLTHLGLENLNLELVSENKRKDVQQLLLPHNRLVVLPPHVNSFTHLHLLDISNNNMAYIGEEILGLTKLKTLLAKNNRLDEFSFPKELGGLRLEVLNLSGNRFEEIPDQFLQIQTLKSLSLGGNRLKSIPAEIENLIRNLPLGVYFDCCVRQIKFVDFCGKYRLPLMHYLCSPECSSPCGSTSQSESDSEDEANAAARRMQKVLLG